MVVFNVLNKVIKLFFCVLLKRFVLWHLLRGKWGLTLCIRRFIFRGRNFMTAIIAEWFTYVTPWNPLKDVLWVWSPRNRTSICAIYDWIVSLCLWLECLWNPRDSRIKILRAGVFFIQNITVIYEYGLTITNVQIKMILLCLHNYWICQS